MGAVAPTGEKQALADELDGARALIEAGEYGAALDRLDAVREGASEQRDVKAVARACRPRLDCGASSDAGDTDR